MARTVFLTGANSGIGLATAELFLSRGWNVVATVRSPASAASLFALVQGSPDNLLIVTLDMRSEASVQPAIDAAVQQFGRVDVLVNNAGYGQFGLLELLSVNDYRRQFEINVFGPIALTKAFLPHFHSQTRDATFTPKIIYTSSGAAHFGVPLASPYTSSKAALDLFAESASLERAPAVHVKLVVPHGSVRSTGFMQSTNSTPATDGLAGSAELQERYGAFVDRAYQLFGRLEPLGMEVGDPARAIWEAATDGTGKLRYFVAPLDGGAMLKKRLEGGGWEEDPDLIDGRYMKFLREQLSGET